MWGIRQVTVNTEVMHLFKKTGNYRRQWLVCA